jgi:nitrate reductase gamma subunit
MLSTVVGVVLPPIAFAIFVAAMASRLWTWKKLPQPGMTLFPTPKEGTTTSILRETLLFPSLFKGDRVLWVLSWVFHVMLAFICIGHVRVITDFPALWAALHINADTMSAVAGGAAGIAIMVMVILLTMRRAMVQRVREISGFADYFAVLLILAIILTGNAMRFFGHFDLALSRAYFVQLLTFQSPVVPQDLWFLAHFFLAQVLFIYIPFSKILHMGGIFFTQAAVKRS